MNQPQRRRATEKDDLNGLTSRIKCVSQLTPLFEAQLLTYLRLTAKRIGLLINFNSRLLKEGIKRMVL